jgi:hypothetical protein
MLEERNELDELKDDFSAENDFIDKIEEKDLADDLGINEINQAEVASMAENELQDNELEDKEVLEEADEDWKIE